jgi:hypothetical protein
MPTAVRRRAEQKKHKARIWGYVSAAAMCIGPWLLPRSPIAIMLGAIVLFGCTVPVALNGYKYAAKWYQYVPIMLFHAVLMGFLGWYLWPKIVISPTSVSFIRPYDSFSFQVKNQTSNDVYNVSPIMHIDGKFDPADWDIRVDSPTTLKYFGPTSVPGMICKDTQGGDVLFPIIPQIDSGQEARFVVTYKGDSKPKLIAENPHVYTEPLAQEEPHESGQGRWQSSYTMKLPIPLGNCYFRPKT